MPSLDALNDARIAAAAKSVNTGAFTESPSYTQQTGRDVPTNTSISNQSQSTPFGQAGSAPVAAGSEYQSVVNDVNKTIKDAEKTLALAKKSGNKKNIAAAQSLVDLSKGELSDLVKLAGSLGGDTGAGSSSDSSIVSRGASAISNTGKNI